MASKRSLISNFLSIDDLKECKLFQNFGNKFLTRFATEASTVCFQEGAIILKEGDIADKLYCLTKGEAAVVVGPEEKLVANLSAVTTFGEMATFQNTRTATVKACEFCVCKTLDYVTFENMLRNHEHERQLFHEIAGERAAAMQKAVQRTARLARFRKAAFVAMVGKSLSISTPRQQTQKLHREIFAEHFKDMEGTDLNIRDFIHIFLTDAELRCRIQNHANIDLADFEHVHNADLQLWFEEMGTDKTDMFSFPEFIEGLMRFRDKRSCEIAKPLSIGPKTSGEEVTKKSKEPHGYNMGGADTNLSSRKSKQATASDSAPSMSSQDAYSTTSSRRTDASICSGAGALSGPHQSRMPSKTSVQSNPWSLQSSHESDIGPSGFALSPQSRLEYPWARQSIHKSDLALSPRSRLSRKEATRISNPCPQICAETAIGELRKSSKARPVLPPPITRGWKRRTTS